MVFGLEISAALAASPARVVLLLDTCRSGAVVSLTPFVKRLTEPSNGVVVLTASAADQLAQESSAWGNGAFTLALVQGLAGDADLIGNGQVPLTGLSYYAFDDVSRRTHGAQTPALAVPSTLVDFPLGQVDP